MTPNGTQPRPYRGRIAPTPTGELHLGHGRTFHTAWKRCRDAGGTLVFRVEDLDAQRCKASWIPGMYADLHWLGISWDEGPDVGGPFGPYVQGERMPWFRETWRRLRDTGLIYPSSHSRRDVALALSAPHEGEEEAPFPPALRPPPGTGRDAPAPDGVNWRFRVPDGRAIAFDDALAGRRTYVAGSDFGDFLVWRKDGFPSYELAVVADDHAMGITEVVRGEDLLLSTARQILLYEALGWTPPAWCHCPLVRDAQGRRLAKRTPALTLHHLRESGAHPEDLLKPGS